MQCFFTIEFGVKAAAFLAQYLFKLSHSVALFDYSPFWVKV
jgi:hypothetical protein